MRNRDLRELRKQKQERVHSSSLSWFVLEATEDEKAAIYKQVIERSAEEQRKVIEQWGRDES